MNREGIAKRRYVSFRYLWSLEIYDLFGADLITMNSIINIPTNTAREEPDNNGTKVSSGTNLEKSIYSPETMPTAPKW